MDLTTHLSQGSAHFCHHTLDVFFSAAIFTQNPESSSINPAMQKHRLNSLQELRSLMTLDKMYQTDKELQFIFNTADQICNWIYWIATRSYLTVLIAWKTSSIFSIMRGLRLSNLWIASRTNSSTSAAAASFVSLRNSISCGHIQNTNMSPFKNKDDKTTFKTQHSLFNQFKSLWTKTHDARDVKRLIAWKIKFFMYCICVCASNCLILYGL